MSKKSTAKKTVAKHSGHKPVKSKAIDKKKGPVSVKKAAAKTIVKKTVKKTAETKNIVHAKTIKKEKITEKKIGLKISMPRKKIVKVKTSVGSNEVEPVIEERVKPITKIKGYSQKDLDHFRQIILAKRDEIIEQLQNLKEQMLDPTTGEYINENSPYSLHMAEQGTDAMEREKTFLYAQRENKFLGYLEDALKRIDSGTYGICLECIDEPQHLCDTCPLIPKARLEAVPHSQLCLPIKQRQEKR
jgi:RNA polymerase-binding transcription factor DksA